MLEAPQVAAQVALPVARVAVDVSLSHLDRPFDYAVTPEQDADAVPGARVRLRFAGKQRDGLILDRLAETEHGGRLAPLTKVISPEPVLTPDIARLVRQVADHYAGCFADVMRLAVPPRHAATEKAASGHADRLVELPEETDTPDPLWSTYPTGPSLLDALRDGRSPRAAWQVTPTAGRAGDWAYGFATAALATLRSGRGSVLIVPDQRDLDRLRAACTQVLGDKAFVVLSADLGPAARYRAFLAVLRGKVQVVIGTRAAAFAPVQKLGLVALWDDGDDLLAEPRAPYPHARDVLALRVADARSAALFAGYGRTAEIQQWVERGWLTELCADRATIRHSAPRVKVSADTDAALERDPAARAARVPREVFTVLRSALPQGPVLVQVPRAGYLVQLVCQTCREPARCLHCGGPTRTQRSGGSGPGPIDCRWCGRLQVGWSCPICGDSRVRAPIIGAARTAEEFGKAFPNTPVRKSMAGQILTEVPSTPSIVVATPGAEPPAEGGYAAAVLLDTHLLLLRPDLRAAEEALRRWLNAVALVRGGTDGGSVIAVGESSGRALQALVRLDPQGSALRELTERAEAHFTPAVKMVTVEGRSSALTEFVELAELPDPTEVLGPVEIGMPPGTDEMLHRLTLRTPLASGAELVRAVKDVTSIRNAKKSEGALRVRVDPAVIE
ncbi:MAG: priA [Propionibacteriaceae bacterium]|nr:priA [Propionibacteriaceae bacterium]